MVKMGRDGLHPVNLKTIYIAQQLQSAFKLYNYIIAGDNSTIDPQILLHHTHELLCLLVHQELQSVEKISCVTDISLLLGSLLPQGHYQNANSLTHDCAMLCHGMTAIVIHFIRLEDSGAPSFSPHKASNFKSQFEGFIQWDIPATTPKGGVDDEAPQSHEFILADGKDQEDVVNEDEEDVAKDLGQEVEEPGSSEVSQSGEDLTDNHVARCKHYFAAQLTSLVVLKIAPLQQTNINSYLWPVKIPQLKCQ